MLNWEILKHPMNWLTIGSMLALLLIALFMLRSIPPGTLLGTK